MTLSQSLAVNGLGAEGECEELKWLLWMKS